MKSVIAKYLGAPLLAFAASVSAGSFTSYGPIYSRYSLAPDRGGGCISGSIGDAIPGNRSAQLYLASEENAKTRHKYAYFGYSDDSVKSDFLPGIAAFHMCLKPGNYRIIAVATADLASKDRIDVPFEVVAGTNRYIGSFVFYGYSPEPDCGVLRARVFVGHRDEFARDAPFLAVKDFPDLALDNATLKIPDDQRYLVSCKSGG